MDKELKKILESSKKEKPEEFFIKVHYLFCRKFGWISPEEFGKLPTPLIFNFLDCIIEEKEIEKKGYKK